MASEQEPLPQSEDELSGMGRKILRHWKEFRPKYVQNLQEKGTLYPTVEQAAIDHSETFSSARSNGLAVDQALELAREPWIQPESQNESQQET